MLQLIKEIRVKMCRKKAGTAQKCALFVAGFFLLCIACDLWTNLSSKDMTINMQPLGANGKESAHSESSGYRDNNTHYCNEFKAQDMEEDYRTCNLTSGIVNGNVCMKRSCPDSLRHIASLSDWLKELFLPNISVFLGRGHFTHLEWKRLQRFNPPYGWMEVNYNVIKRVISWLPDQTHLSIHNRSSDPQCVTCAVVGNGGILKGSNMGREIDLHDYIFRGNGAAIKGFEKDVGHRTSFYGFTESTVRECLRGLTESGFTGIPDEQETHYIHLPESATDYHWLHNLLASKEINPGVTNGDHVINIFADKLDKLFVLHPDFMRYIKSRFFKSENLKGPRWCLYRPSIGATLLMTALHVCDKVNAYGFMTENYDQFSGYYYDRVKKPLRFSKDHDFFLERDLWRKLDSLQVIRLYRRT